VMRDHVIPSVLSWVGFLFPKDVIDTFTAILIRL
jgi:hypothetical protein